MSTPTPITALARRWRLEVDMSETETPDYQLCPAITEFQWEAPNNLEDSSVYEDGGWAGNTKTGQEWSVTVTFNRKASADSTVFNDVHEKIRTTALDEIGQIGIRFMDRNGLPEAYSGTALPEWAPSGGSRTDLDQVEVTFTGTGPLTSIANPLAA